MNDNFVGVTFGDDTHNFWDSSKGNQGICNSIFCVRVIFVICGSSKYITPKEHHALFIYPI